MNQDSKPRGSETSEASPPAQAVAEPAHHPSHDRGAVIGEALKATSTWSLRLIIIGIGLAALLWLLSRVWVGVLPVLLALIISTMLWPPVAWLTRHRVPAALAAILAVLGGFAVIGGALTLIAPSVVDQSRELVDAVTRGLQQLQDWLLRPPFALDEGRMNGLLSTLSDELQSRATQIASGLATGVSALSSFLVTTALVLVLTFFFLKDGPKFLPWLSKSAGRRAGGHLTTVFGRIWDTLGGFIRTQALVSAVDALFIGIGLLIMGVPLAPALAVLVFFGGFIPIVGAFTVGALAILVALVSNGPGVALAVLILIIVVQQVEGNFLQPFLQGKSMRLHAGIILLAVAAGGTIFGIIGAFLAVPVAASVVVVLRYIDEQVDLRAAAGGVQPTVEPRGVTGDPAEPISREAISVGTISSTKAPMRSIRQWRDVPSAIKARLRRRKP